VRQSCRPQLRTHVVIVVSVVDADAGAESVVDADSDAVAAVAIAYAVAVVVVAITTGSHHFKRQSWRQQQVTMRTHVHCRRSGRKKNCSKLDRGDRR
jgi:hypothetical protein